MRKQSKGYCKYCGNEYTKTGMIRHLASCKMRKAVLEDKTGKMQNGCYEIGIYDKYSPKYFLFIEISEELYLASLDQFIRDIWVECCNHMSMFRKENTFYEITEYEDYYDSYNDIMHKSMEEKIKDVFCVGDKIEYQYDFGTSTELIIKVYNYRKGKIDKDEIIILSRNHNEPQLCTSCKKNTAKWIDAYAESERDWMLCDKCRNKKYDEEKLYYLPLCNSPRTGVCAYEGSKNYPDQFEPDVTISNNAKPTQKANAKKS